VITKRGKPVAKLIPFSADSADLIGSLKHARLSTRSGSTPKSSQPECGGMLNVGTRVLLCAVVGTLSPSETRLLRAQP